MRSISLGALGILYFMFTGASSFMIPNAPTDQSATKHQKGALFFNANTLQKQIHHFEFLPSVHTERKYVGSIRLMSFFGLGVPEIAIILVAAAFLLGPQKIAELGRDAGKMTKELKKVPEEFQKGLEEGEIEARSKRAKPMDDISRNSTDDNGESKK